MNGFWTGEGAAPKRKKYLLPKRHATLMQPLHYDLQRPAAKKMLVQYYVRSRRDKQPWCNHYSAICAGKWQHACIYAQPNWSTIPQTAHCDLRGANLGTTSIAATTSRASCPSSPAATTAEHRGGTKKGQNEHGRSRFTLPAPATIREKTQCFVPRHPPQHKSHATCTQPLQCILHRHVANLHVSIHIATEHDNNHTAIPLRSATADSQTLFNHAHIAAITKNIKIKGPDNPTGQLLPVYIIMTKVVAGRGRKERQRRWCRIEKLKKYPPSNFSYEMGRTWATVQIASQVFFVQTGGVVPPILYLESFCCWFLSNHHFHFVVVYVELVEASNVKSH